jgi:hypothetical protein
MLIPDKNHSYLLNIILRDSDIIADVLALKRTVNKTGKQMKDAVRLTALKNQPGTQEP